MKLSRKKLILGILLITLAGFAFYFFTNSKIANSANSLGNTTSGNQKEIYHCPMHPAVTSDHPGKCPICHMDLVHDDHDHDGDHDDHHDDNSDHQAHLGPATASKTADQDNSSAAAKNAAPEKNPSAEPKASPKIIFYQNPMNAKITSPVPAKDNMGMDYIPVYSNENDEKDQGKDEVLGRGSFSLSAEKQQLIGVASVEVKKQKLRQEIRSTGRVAFDPELFTAIEEHRQALIGKKAIGESGFAGMKEEATSLVASSKTKLKLMGLTDDQIRKLSSTNASAMNLLLPQGKVWVYAEVFEYEVTGIKPGQSIEAEAPSNTGEIFRGLISSISPVLNGPSRTVRVRAEVPDPKGLLRPDTYLTVRILKDLGEKIAVPEDSVLHVDGKDFVFVQKENRFEPRAVTLGAKAGNLIEVVSGLVEGERVVTAANFLLDSESRLKAVLSDKMKSSEHSQ